MKKRLWRFAGGIKLPGFKSISNLGEIKKLPLPSKLYIPLQQHIGAAATPVVKVGDPLLKGQVIAQTNGYISSPVHAPSSGVVVEIRKYPIPHPSAITATTVIMETDNLDQWHPSVQATPRPHTLSISELRKRIRDAGIVGLGGAVFPSAVKLKPTREIETLLINGVECEPYITCDDVLMRARAEDIIRGVLLLSRIIRPIEIIIAIEDNKKEAFDAIVVAIRKLKLAGVAAASMIIAVKVPTIFPAGGEKQLVKVITGKEVPSGRLPYEVGVVCLNVGTVAAVQDAIFKGQPLLSRIVTVTGNDISAPGNYEVLLGTPINYLLDSVVRKKQTDPDVIMGGPMMGMAISNLNAPVVKATNCLLVKQKTNPQIETPAMPCIRCGQCATVCPMKLLPQQLYWHARARSLEKLELNHIADCIECGCCAVVCPSRLPLVHYFHYAKSEIKAQVHERKKADISRIRNEARDHRLENIKREQEERKAKRKASRKKKNVKSAPASNISAPSNDVSEKQKISAS